MFVSVIPAQAGIHSFPVIPNDFERARNHPISVILNLFQDLNLEPF